MKAVDFFNILDQSVQADDIVYTGPSARFIMSLYTDFYGQQWPDNYMQSQRNCWSDYTMCIREVSNIVMESESKVGDVWIIYPVSFAKELKRYDERGNLESFGGSRHDAGNLLPLVSLTLLRFPADGGLLNSVRQEWLAEYRPLLTGDPAVRSFFDVHYNDGQLTYVREACAPADAAAQFYLHIYPDGSPNVLPEWSQPYGFENRDFDFLDRVGALLENRCLITVALPDYDIASIHTGQYADAGRIWEVEFAP